MFELDKIMATLKLVILKTKILSDGKTKLRISVSHKGDVRYIVTNYAIEVTQFKNGRVIAHPDAAILNRRLQSIILDYEEIIQDINLSSISCSELKDFLLSKSKKTTSISEVWGEYIHKLNLEKRKSTSDLHKRTLNYFIDAVGSIPIRSIFPSTIEKFDFYLREKGFNDTTISMHQKRLRAVINLARKRGYVHFDIDPFSSYKIPTPNIRELDITIDDIRKIVSSSPATRGKIVAKDLFLLSFYLGGINLIDLMKLSFSDNQTEISYERTKTINTKKGNKMIRISIPEQAAIIIDKWKNKQGKLDFGYKLSYDNFRKQINKELKALALEVGITRHLVYYSARKSFAQIGFELGIPLEVLEFTIGHSMKRNRPIFNYVRIMQKQADEAIRTVISAIE